MGVGAAPVKYLFWELAVKKRFTKA